LNGVIVDVNGARIPRAVITFQNRTIRCQCHSDEAGQFAVYLPVGTYNMTVEVYAFKKYSLSNLRLKTGKNRQVDVQLEVQAIIDREGVPPSEHVPLTKDKIRSKISRSRKRDQHYVTKRP